VCVENINLCEVGKVGYVENDTANGGGGLVEEVGDLVYEDAVLASFGREEGVEGIGVILGSVSRSTNTTV
jgi:hypothetical protein